MNSEVMKRYRNPVHRIERSGAANDAGKNALTASGDNPLCGDRISMTVVVSDDAEKRIEDAWWTGYGCSLAIASAEALIEIALGKTARACLAIESEEVSARLGDIEVGRSRANCLALPVTVMKEAVRSC